MMKVGIVGLGSWGKELLGYFNEVPDVRVTAVCKRSPDVRGFNLGEATLYTDMKEFFAKEELDAVVVSTPPTLHLLPTRMAARRGTHVFCEKPMAASVEDCDAMIDVCDKHGVVLFVGFKHRYAKALAYLKRNLKQLGRPLWAMYTYPLWKVDDPGWKFVEEGTKGIVVENVVHAIDVLRYLMGNVARVYAEANAGVVFEYATVPDSAIFSLRFKNGAIAAIGGGCTSDPAISREYLDIHFEAGLARVWGELDRPFNLVFLMRDEGMLEQHVFEGSDGVREEVRHFITCIRQGEVPLATGVDGREAVRVALAVVESWRQEKPVQLPSPEG